MATYDYREGGGPPKGTSFGKDFCIDIPIDCDAVNAGSAEVQLIMDIPAGTLIKRVAIYQTTLEGGTLTVDIGDHLPDSPTYTVVDADGYMDGMDLNSAVGWITDEVTISSEGAASPAYGVNGKLYTADSCLSITYNNAADAAQFVVRVWGAYADDPA